MSDGRGRGTWSNRAGLAEHPLVMMAKPSSIVAGIMVVVVAVVVVVVIVVVVVVVVNVDSSLVAGSVCSSGSCLRTTSPRQHSYNLWI